MGINILSIDFGFKGQNKENLVQMCIRGCQDDNFHKNQIEQKLKFYLSVFQEKSQGLVGFPLQNKGVG